MKKIFLLIIILLSFIKSAESFTYYWDFEDGSDGSSIYSTGNTSYGADSKQLEPTDASNVTYDDSTSADGTYCANYAYAALSNMWTTRSEFEPGVSVSEGDDFYVHVDLYLPSITTFTPNTYSGNGAEMKFFRINFTDASGNYKGGIFLLLWCVDDRVYLRMYCGSPVQDYMSWDTTDSYGQVFMSSVGELSQNAWHSIDAHWSLSAIGNGSLTLTVDESTYTDNSSGVTNGNTLHSDVTKTGPAYIFSQWNGYAGSSGNIKIDNLYVSNEEDYSTHIGSVPVSDTTSPSLATINPPLSSSGVLITQDPIISFTITDGGDGVDVSETRITVEGSNKTTSLATSGNDNDGSVTYTLPLSSVSLSYEQTVDWQIGATDMAGNAMATQSGSFIIEEENPETETQFGTGYVNDFDNWTPILSYLWRVYNDSGDYVMQCYRSDYTSSGQGDLGAVIEYAGTYDQCTLSASIRCDENLATNGNADYAIVLHKTSNERYVTVNLNKNSGSNAIAYWNAGEFTYLTTLEESLITDNNWHDLSVTDVNEVITLYIDGVEKMSADYSAYDIPAGTVGFGSYNDAFSVDDVSITNLGTYYVANSGDDTATGSSSDPWKTIAKVNSAQLDISYDMTGSTVNLNGGDTWKETLRYWVDNLTVQSYGTGQAIIDGSDVVTDWTQDGSNWYNDTYNETVQVWEDNERLTFRNYDDGESVDDVGQFGYLSTSGQIIIRCTDDANPNTHTIEVGARNVGVWMSHNNGTNAKNRTTGSILDNICIKKVAGAYSSATGGLKMIDGNNDLLVYAFIDSQGDSNILRNCTIQQIGGGETYNINDTRLITVWSASVEFYKARYGQAYGNTIIDGTTVGLNMETLENNGEYYIMHDNYVEDVGTVGAITFLVSGGEMYNNTVVNAKRVGIYVYGHQYYNTNIYNNKINAILRPFRSYDVDTYGTFNCYNNIFHGGSEEGMWITVRSQDMNIYNNTIKPNSGGIGVSIAGDPADACTNINLNNNVISVVGDYALYLSNTNHTYTGNYNCFYRSDPGSWFFRAADKSFSTFKSETGQEANSLVTNPLFSSITDFKLLPTSPCIHAAGAPLVDYDYYGNKRTNPDDIGAVKYTHTSLRNCNL